MSEFVVRPQPPKAGIGPAELVAICLSRSLDVAIAWYSNLFGYGPDRRASTDSAEWDLPLGGGLRIESALGREGAPRDPFIAIRVEDVSTVASGLAARGLHDHPVIRPDDDEGVVRYELVDPDGNTIWLMSSS